MAIVTWVNDVHDLSLLELLEFVRAAQAPGVSATLVEPTVIGVPPAVVLHTGESYELAREYVKAVRVGDTWAHDPHDPV